VIERIKCGKQPLAIELIIATRRKTKIWIKVADRNKKNTFYFTRFADIDGKRRFVINMPISPEVADVIVYSAKRGLVRKDSSFRVLKIKKIPLVVNSLKKLSKKTLSFVKFAEEFCNECGYLPASVNGDTYRSNNGKFRIDYFDVIRTSGTDKELGTPARISQLTGKIEVSAKAFRKYTIPMRMAILMHEYSHYYENEVPSDESEADINGLKIYFSRGYPKISAYNVFLNVFKRSPSVQNKNRFDKLDSFIREYTENENKLDE
jgi:hypothetical protein|tara:strand:- start:9369 stop:10157 length:789 start_codon:yes stop_codon:yes gene_type:complete